MCATQVCESGSRGPVVGRSIDRKYRVERLVAEGGMGAVYRATHLELDRPVALKIVRPDVLSDPAILGRFRREARALVRLMHPHIVRCYDAGAGPETGAYLVIEWLEGCSLRDELED